MGKFVEGVEFEVIHCAACDMVFGMSADFIRRRRDDHKSFYCPNGHANVYKGKSEADKLRDKLADREAALQREQANTRRARHERDQVSKAHRKMRRRVMNGVCPCCNRSFENLRRHMETQHSDFGQEKTLKALREAFGMTQAAVAEEAWTKPVYVSLYERGRPVPAEARESLEGWLESQGAA